MATLEGDLALMPLPDLVIWLANRRVRGELRVQDGTDEHRFTISEGVVLRASTTDPRGHLGQFLLQLDMLDEDALRRAVETQQETNVRLGRILVMVGQLTEAQVVRALELKIRETVLQACRWTQGRFWLKAPADEDLFAEIGVAVPLIDLHTDSIHRADFWAQFEQIFPTRRLLVAVDEPRIPRTLDPRGFTGRLLSLARTGMDLEALALELHASDYQVATQLIELFRLGVIAPREPSSPRERPNPSALAPTLDLPREHVPVLLVQPSPEMLKRLSPKQRYVLARVDGKRSVQSIMHVSPMLDTEALEILRQFERDGVLRCQPETA